MALDLADPRRPVGQRVPQAGQGCRGLSRALGAGGERRAHIGRVFFTSYVYVYRYSYFTKTLLPTLPSFEDIILGRKSPSIEVAEVCWCIRSLQGTPHLPPPPSPHHLDVVSSLRSCTEFDLQRGAPPSRNSCWNSRCGCCHQAYPPAQGSTSGALGTKRFVPL